MNRPRLLNIDEAAELTRKPVATMRWLRHTGEGPVSFKLGRRVVYDEADVIAWIDRQRAEQGRAAG